MSKTEWVLFFATLFLLILILFASSGCRMVSNTLGRAITVGAEGVLDKMAERHAQAAVGKAMDDQDVPALVGESLIALVTHKWTLGTVIAAALAMLGKYRWHLSVEKKKNGNGNGGKE